MGELRQDPISRKWVIIAENRAKRPESFRSPKNTPTPKKHDPFCEVCFTDNPIELLAYSKRKNRKPNEPGWTVRVIPNKYPAFHGGASLNKQTDGLYTRMDGLGYNEVIVTVDPKKSLGQMTKLQVQEVLRAYQERMLVHAKNPLLQYCLIMHNHGPEAAASIAHPHSQLFAIPIITNYIKDELDAAKAYYKKHRRSVFTDLVKEEQKRKVRMVYANKLAVAFCPYAAKMAFETWIMLKAKSPRFEKITSAERKAVADVLQTVLGRMHKLLKNPGYNFYIHTAPIDGQKHDYYHWQLEILPRLNKAGGFELGSAMYVNPLSPEQAAAFMK